MKKYLLFLIFNQLLTLSAYNQVYYYDFTPNDSDITVLNRIDKKIRKAYKDYAFTREIENLTSVERDDIFKHIRQGIKTAKSDSNNTYRVHFFADKKMERFQVIACSKNYTDYVAEHRNGAMSSRLVGVKPAYELHLENFDKLVDSNDFKYYQTILYESFVNVLSDEVERIDLDKRFGYSTIKIDTTFKELLRTELYKFSRDDMDRWQKGGTSYYSKPNNPESKLSYQKRTEFYTEEIVAYEKLDGEEVEVIYITNILPHSVSFSFEFERYQERDSLNIVSSWILIQVESKYIGLTYLNDEKNQTLWTERKAINEYLDSYIFEKSMKVLLYKLKWGKMERLK